MRNPFAHKKIRAIWDKARQIHWYSANDVMQVLTKGTYVSAKSYWKYIKRTDPRFDLMQGYRNNQLTLPARDGKCYLSDVLTPADIIHLIRTIKHQNSKSHKKALQRLGERLLRQHLFTLAKQNAPAVLKNLSHRQVRFAQTIINRLITFDAQGGYHVTYGHHNQQQVA